MVDVRLKPTFSPAEAEAIVLKHYDIVGTAYELTGERDQNFIIKDSSGSQWVLKVANLGEDIDNLDFQNQVLQRVAEIEPLLPIPHLKISKTGEAIALIQDEIGSSFFVRLLTYLPGIPLADVQVQKSQMLQKLGRYLARFDKALAGYWHPAANRKFQWSIHYTSEVIGRGLSAIKDVEDRSIVEHFFADFESRIAPLMPQLRSGVIHSDANDHNVLVAEGPGDNYQISGLIDFGDMVYGPYVYEPAVAAAYAVLEEDDLLGTAAQVIRGYHEEHPLESQEVALIFNLICIRLCTSVVLSAKQKYLAPTNEYLTISEEAAWRALRKLVGIEPIAAEEIFFEACQLPRVKKGFDPSEILDLRRKHLGPSLSISYDRPLHIVRGFRQYLYDAEGRAYLDAVNNVPHVGHCHPRVVKAGKEQMAVLNTNTRYLHESIVRYATRLCKLLPEPLSVCFFVCSGSEANELALRLARSHSGKEGIVVLDGAYHGNTGRLVDISPYKFDGPGGHGAPEYVHKVPMPDTYRGLYKGDDPQAGEKYANDVGKIIDEIRGQYRAIGAFICESLLGCGGQIVLPDNYLREVFKRVWADGGVCIVDEVQVGFGRVGNHFWGFETQGVIPDIVTMGKPMGNGHPLAAVVTTPEIATSFDTGMEYFNTFGGNPVSCAIGLAVLDVLEEEELQKNALMVGELLMAGLRQLQEKYQLIGDVRGLGLFIGVELVKDRVTLEPAGREAAVVVESMKDHGILISTDGPYHNVLKIKPPLVFTEANAFQLVRTLDLVLEKHFG
jgi:4-aminobutyrate aminotransferase-like enzyme/Ser/Thr protein kinase RdoA (MazF antagonist)